MTKSTKTANPLTSDNPMISAMRMLTPMPLGGPHMRHFWQAQDQFLREMERFSEGWFQRRHTGTETALSTTEEIADPSNPMEAWRNLAEWQVHSMERVAEDWREFLSAMTRCSEIWVRNETEAVEEAAEAAGKSAKSAKAVPA